VTARICSFILFFTLAAAPFAQAGLQERVLEKVLPNGLKVILLENHKAPVATFQVWYRVGSRNEAWGKTGLSHMLEHMMFKGTKKLGEEEYSKIIQENGGNENASTSYDYTNYFATLRSDRIGIPLELEADRMENAVLEEEKFRTERMVVMEERRWTTADNPRAVVNEQMMATAFQIQPYHWPIIGWMEDIERFTLQDLKDYHDIYYIPSNAFIIAVGDFKKEQLLGSIEKAFGGMPKKPAPSQMKPVEERQLGERRLLVKREAQVPYLTMGFHVPNLKDPDAYVLELIEVILSGGKSSRLYEKLVREKRLALNAAADNSLLSRDPGLFTISVDPLAGREMSAVEKALEEELERLRSEPVSSEELEKAKNQAEAEFVYGQDSLFYQAMLLGQFETASDWKKIDGYIPSIRKVTAGDIVRVARKYFTPENRTTGILVPLPPREGASPKPQAPAENKMTR